MASPAGSPEQHRLASTGTPPPIVGKPDHPLLPQDAMIAEAQIRPTSPIPSKTDKPVSMGHVIILTGIVAAGKSSIVKAVQSVDPQFHEEDLDLRRNPKTPTTPEMELQMIDDTINRSLAGEKTIISLMKAEAFAQRMLEREIVGIPVTTVLAHCPFSEIPGRLETRNRAAEAPGGDTENYRDPLVPMDQFAELYVHDENGIEMIDRAQASEFFNSSFDKMVDHAKKVGDSLPSDEQIAQDKIEGCNVFLKQLGFTDESQKTVNAAPRSNYDLVIDTSKYRDAGSREKLFAKLLADFTLRTPISPSMEIDVQSAKEAYLSATDNPHDSHVAVGILRPDGSISELNLGKNEAYGAHRIGSVTKTFTAFLALKLMNDGIINLETSLGDLIDKKLIDEKVLQGVFADPEKAKLMTLEQLLSHTSGLEYDDKPRIGPDGTEDPNVRLSTLNERFTYQATLDKKYEHKHEPGEGVGLYSNLGFDVAAWMLELVYNADKGNKTPQIPFSQIMRDELFTKVFKLSEDTRISPGFTGNGDVIQAGCGDMVSSVSDLLKVAQALQKGEEHLSSYFGEEWQKKMLGARGSDGTYTYGLGCEANASSIQFSGLNYERFEDGIERDVTAHVAFPLRPNQPGIVAMCDSNALGPLENQVKFREELRKLAGLSVT